MYNLDRALLAQKAAETGFIRDNLEKVYRLTDVLAFLSEHPVLSSSLVLKGGTAINLTVFDLPRLSVDIDLDFHRDCSREEMLSAREEITALILRYMNASGYMLNADKGKNPHALDSWVFYYQNAGGNRDNIKIEINYSMRCHILPIHQTEVKIDVLDTGIKINALAPVELFGSKIKALLERTAARDLYDIYNMIRFRVFDKGEMTMLRKCVLFYKAVGSTGDFHEEISLDSIDRLNFTKIRQTLLPVLRKGESIDLALIKSEVKAFLHELLTLTERETTFLYAFANGVYQPDLLFDDADTVKRIIDHPMAIWKSNKIHRSKKK